jgi:hypothetical protein
VNNHQKLINMKRNIIKSLTALLGFMLPLAAVAQKWASTQIPKAARNSISPAAPSWP